jgi:hypothetical protein
MVQNIGTNYLEGVREVTTKQMFFTFTHKRLSSETSYHASIIVFQIL